MFKTKSNLLKYFLSKFLQDHLIRYNQIKHHNISNIRNIKQNTQDKRLFTTHPPYTLYNRKNTFYLNDYRNTRKIGSKRNLNYTLSATYRMLM